MDFALQCPLTEVCREQWAIYLNEVDDFLPENVLPQFNETRTKRRLLHMKLAKLCDVWGPR